jgi:glycosyltransferase involved in cell wall biosynthesis
VREMVSASSAKAQSYALAVSRLAPEKGLDVAIAACRQANVELVVAGDGPQRAQLEKQAEQSHVRFAGHVPEAELSKLRAKAAIALVPSRSAETFGMSAAEAMAAGLPVAASRIGALPELLADECLVPAGDAGALAKAIERLRGDRQVAEQGLRQVRAICAPANVAARLAEVYDGGPNT